MPVIAVIGVIPIRLGGIMPSDLLSVIGHDVPLRKVGSGHEYTGACPFCGEGHDRFHVWPTPREGKPRYWCRRCDQKGDLIQYLRDHDGLSYMEARRQSGEDLPEPSTAERPLQPPAVVGPPPLAWQERAQDFIAECLLCLWSDAGAK